MARIIAASIDLNKVDKSMVQTTDKNGNPFKNGAKYLNVQIVINDEKDQYGNDASIRLVQSQAEREAGTPKVYLGNGKTVWSDGRVGMASSTPSPQNQEAPQDEDDLPF